MYISIKKKYFLSLVFSLTWMGLSIWISIPWYQDLSDVIGKISASFIIIFIAIIPGCMNAFLAMSLFIDKRPKLLIDQRYPAITILIAAYNEQKTIATTLEGIFKQEYPAELQIILINDGSTDKTLEVIKIFQKERKNLKVINLEINSGKANALNNGLAESNTDVIICIDADCYIYKNGLINIVGRYLSDPIETKAIAGTILIRNSRENWITKAQEWDYFLGIASIKRAQSLYHGTLVAQGAFSLFDRKLLIELGGWPNMLGEDIVLTWKILCAGYRVGHAEDALVFTECPNTLKKYTKQRQRWSRGIIEAFKENPSILYKPRLSTLFNWWNLLFPLIDISYTFFFIPGLFLSFFGIYWIVGPMTVALLPIALLLNWLIFVKSKEMFYKQKLKIRTNLFGFMFYVFAYGLILQPACVYGYFSELFNFRKNWGTK